MRASPASVHSGTETAGPYSWSVTSRTVMGSWVLFAQRGEAVAGGDIEALSVVVLLEQRENFRAPGPFEAAVAVHARLHQVRGADGEVGLVDTGVESVEKTSRFLLLTLTLQPTGKQPGCRLDSGESSTNANRRRIAASTSAIDRSAVFMVPITKRLGGSAKSSPE